MISTRRQVWGLWPFIHIPATLRRQPRSLRAYYRVNYWKQAAKLSELDSHFKDIDLRMASSSEWLSERKYNSLLMGWGATLRLPHRSTYSIRYSCKATQLEKYFFNCWKKVTIKKRNMQKKRCNWCLTYDTANNSWTVKSVNWLVHQQIRSATIWIIR